jgi:hypothetical protein
MAAYNAVVKRIRGVNNDTTAAAIQAYIESLDSTNDTIISVDVVGDNNYVTAIIVHNTTS